MKNKIITIIFIIYIFTFSFLGIVLKDSDISISERRMLSSFPEYTLSNEYITKLDKYLLDHFPFRDNFRSLKAYFNYNVLQKLDNNNIYLEEDYIFKSEYPTNKKSIANFVKKINLIRENLTEENNVYMMAVPDKNYYLQSDNFLHIDYDYIYDELYKLNIEMIDIRNIMELNDYYKTDTHWRQEKLDKVVLKMSEIMDFKYQNIIYHENDYNNFYGVYYGEAAISSKPETITYLTNYIISNLRVEYLENKSLTTIYNLDNLTGLDSYEVYLDGASSFIEIYNDNSVFDKELIIFRDSFASSLTPLLTNYYKKIVLIDNRYINSSDYMDMINFGDQDVLFMYSTLMINNSTSLKG